MIILYLNVFLPDQMNVSEFGGSDRRIALWLLKRESYRYVTFEDDWQHEHIPALSRREFARAGFFYTGDGDKVQCAFCLIIIFCWEPLDIPMAEHRHFTIENGQHFCPFVAGLAVGNIPANPFSPRANNFQEPPPDRGHDVVGTGGSFSRLEALSQRLRAGEQPSIVPPGTAIEFY